jgi:hypothetical protein
VFACVPAAETAGVRLAAHPDDPPVPRLRDTPRLVHQPHLYQRGVQEFSIYSSDDDVNYTEVGTFTLKEQLPRPLSVQPAFSIRRLPT